MSSSGKGWRGCRFEGRQAKVAASDTAQLFEVTSNGVPAR